MFRNRDFRLNFAWHHLQLLAEELFSVQPSVPLDKVEHHIIIYII